MWPTQSTPYAKMASTVMLNQPRMWARATFEGLAILPSMEGNSKVITLPGDQLFQAASLTNLDHSMRAPILHAYGPNKETAPETLEQLAHEGWETLLPTIWRSRQTGPLASWHLDTGRRHSYQDHSCYHTRSLLWYRSQRPGPAPAWPLQSCHQHNQQAISLEKALQDIPIREPSRFITAVDIIMLNKLNLLPELVPLAKHICETAATDSGRAFHRGSQRSVHKLTYRAQSS